MARRYLREALIDARRREVPIVLIGSHARGTSSRGVSDIDVLVIDDPRRAAHTEAVHVVTLSPDQLAERVRAGDDFAQWALRYGVPLTCQGQWEHLAERLLSDAPWPSSERKFDQLARRHAVAEDLLSMGDLDAAREETGSALNLASRAVLLRAGEFPLSTPELPAQLRAIGEGGLAEAIEAFRSGALISDGEIRRLLALIRSTMVELSESASREALASADQSNALSNERCRTEPDPPGRDAAGS